MRLKAIVSFVVVVLLIIMLFVVMTEVYNSFADLTFGYQNNGNGSVNQNQNQDQDQNQDQEQEDPPEIDVQGVSLPDEILF